MVADLEWRRETGPMTPESLREDIPTLAESTYLNWGASGPSPRTVVEAVSAALESQEYHAPGSEGMYEAAAETMESARGTVAEFIGAAAGEVALTESTADGINRIATSMDWSAGDTVVTTDLEHSAGRLPWQRLEREFGVDVRVVPSESAVLDMDEMESALSGATLVCISALDWLYGRRQPVGEVVETAHDHDALVLVDAVQVPGQRPIDVGDWGADFVVAAGHKWLLGPWGAGFLYVRDDVVRDLRPAAVGYRSVEDPTADPYAFSPDASRFEVGTTSPAPYAGLERAMEVIESVGLDVITDRIRDLTDRFKDGVPAERLRSPDSYHSGLVTVRVEDPESVVASLAEESIVVRALPMPESVRLSFHAVNTLEDVDAAVDALSEVLE